MWISHSVSSLTTFKHKSHVQNFISTYAFACKCFITIEWTRVEMPFIIVCGVSRLFTSHTWNYYTNKSLTWSFTKQNWKSYALHLYLPFTRSGTSNGYAFPLDVRFVPYWLNVVHYSPWIFNWLYFDPKTTWMNQSLRICSHLIGAFQSCPCQPVVDHDSRWNHRGDRVRHCPDLSKIVKSAQVLRKKENQISVFLKCKNPSLKWRYLNTFNAL